MGSANNTLALLTSSEFKWTAQIQYMVSLGNRDEAIRYASQHGCNLIVKYEKRSGPQFDVMLDPDSSWTARTDCEVIDATPALKSGGWKKRSLLGMFGLSRRVPSAAAAVSQL